MVTKDLNTIPEGRTRLYKEYGMTPEGIANDVEAIKDWINKQPHLPDLSSINVDAWLENLLLLTKNSVQRAKSAVDHYITGRTVCPELFTDRDVREPDIRNSFSQIKISVLPGLTAEGHRVIIMKLASPNPELYSLEAHMKRCLMMMDIYLRDGVDFTGMHVVHDLEHFKVGHLGRFSFQLMKMMTVGMKAYPIRIPKITMINTPSHIDRLIALFRPFMSTKIMSRVSSCKDPSQLLKMLPSKIVPSNYGGEASTLDEMNEMWHQILDENRNHFQMCDSLKSDESRRIGKELYPKGDFGENGSFRQISVD